ncbi:MAG: four helix bundle protein [Ignavibacteriaceae bacterium]|jgi:four helix bundle protein|nr:four helix bundle protein [Ignavibacteriaceae bacterium]
MLKLNHKNLDVWKLAVKLVSTLYQITSKYPKEEVFGLISQTRRASVSISANIAEGSSRKSLVERKRFFEISRSSLVEVDNHIEVAIELGFIGEKSINELDEKLNELFAKLSKFIEKAK